MFDGREGGRLPPGFRRRRSASPELRRPSPGSERARLMEADFPLGPDLGSRGPLGGPPGREDVRMGNFGPPGVPTHGMPALGEEVRRAPLAVVAYVRDKRGGNLKKGKGKHSLPLVCVFPYLGFQLSMTDRAWKQGMAFVGKLASLRKVRPKSTGAFTGIPFVVELMPTSFTAYGIFKSRLHVLFGIAVCEDEAASRFRGQPYGSIAGSHHVESPFPETAEPCTRKSCRVMRVRGVAVALFLQQ